VPTVSQNPTRTFDRIEDKQAFRPVSDIGGQRAETGVSGGDQSQPSSGRGHLSDELVQLDG
jgi:hypothetical protein